jgi:hypothetical protein
MLEEDLHLYNDQSFPILTGDEYLDFVVEHGRQLCSKSGQIATLCVRVLAQDYGRTGMNRILFEEISLFVEIYSFRNRAQSYKT